MTNPNDTDKSQEEPTASPSSRPRAPSHTPDPRQANLIAAPLPPPAIYQVVEKRAEQVPLIRAATEVLPAYVRLSLEQAHVVDLTSKAKANEPGALASRLVQQHLEGKLTPNVVCVDARRVEDAEVVYDWLVRFGSPLSDEPVKVTNDVLSSREPFKVLARTAGRGPGFYSPSRVVLASVAVAAVLRNKPELYGVAIYDSFPTDGIDALDAYQSAVARMYARSFNRPDNPSNTPDGRQNIDTESRLSPAQRAEWEALMREQEPYHDADE